MDRKTLKKKLHALVRGAGPAELLIALSEVLTGDMVDSAPHSDDLEIDDAIDSVPELRAWTRLIDGPLARAVQATIKLEDEIGYPPADQQNKPQNQGRGGVMEALFPWLRR